MDADSNDVNVVVDAVQRELPTPWADIPAGWRRQAEAALIDAVLSIRARYGQPHNGVQGAVKRWRTARAGSKLDDLSVLASYEPGALAELLGNQQRLSGGATKAAAIVHAARNLTGVGAVHAADLAQPSTEHKRAYVGVNGLGPVTWVYFLMLLGVPDIKADTWIVRFVAAALRRSATSDEARALISAAARELDVSPITLDHAIWSYVRGKPSQLDAVAPVLSTEDPEIRYSRECSTAGLAHAGLRPGPRR